MTGRKDSTEIIEGGGRLEEERRGETDGIALLPLSVEMATTNSARRICRLFFDLDYDFLVLRCWPRLASYFLAKEGFSPAVFSALCQLRAKVDSYNQRVGAKKLDHLRIWMGPVLREEE